jgi:hypothetical protein
MYIENGVVQGTFMSVTLFLVVMAEIMNQIRQPVKIVGYADDWAICTSDRDMETAETNLQTAINGFKISPEKTVCMYIFRKGLTIIETRINSIERTPSGN